MRYRVAAETDLEPDSLMRVDAGGVEICLARTEDGSWYAISDICTHEDFSLSKGDLWGVEVECVMHGSRFNLITGAPDQLPAAERVKTYLVTVEGGEVFVDV